MQCCNWMTVFSGNASKAWTDILDLHCATYNHSPNYVHILQYMVVERESMQSLSPICALRHVAFLVHTKLRPLFAFLSCRSWQPRCESIIQGRTAVARLRLEPIPLLTASASV